MEKFKKAISKLQSRKKISPNILIGLSLFLLVFIPLYFKFPLFFVSGTFVTIRLEDIVLFSAYLYFLVYLIRNGELKKVLYSKYSLILIAFFVVGLISTLIGSMSLFTTSTKLGMLHLVRRVEYMLMLPLGLYVGKYIKNPKDWILTLIIISFVVNIYAVGQKYFGFPAISTINSELSKGFVYKLGLYDRVNSTFSGHYDLAVYLLMLIPIFASIAIYIWNRHNKNVFKTVRNKEFIVLTTAAVFSFAILILTAARLSFFAAAAGIFFLILILRQWRLMLFGFFAFVLILSYPSQLRERLISTFTVNFMGSFNGYNPVNEIQKKRSMLNIPTLPSDNKKIESQGVDAPDIAPGEPTDATDLAVFRSFEIRSKVEWPRAIRAFTRNPLTGSGYASIGLATDNDFLRSLGEVGVLGTLIFVEILFFIAKDLYKRFRLATGEYRFLLAGVISFFVAFIVNALFIDVFEASKVATTFWLLLGLSLSFPLGVNKT